MSKQFRNVASVLVSVVLLGMLTQASANTDKNTKNDEHHSRLSKAAFWKHHKHQDKAAKPSPAAPQKAHTQKARPKAAELKPASAKKTTGTKSEAKAHVSKAHATKASKPAGKPKSVGVAKTNTSKKSTNGQTSSFKQ